MHIGINEVLSIVG